VYKKKIEITDSQQRLILIVTQQFQYFRKRKEDVHFEFL